MGETQKTASLSLRMISEQRRRPAPGGIATYASALASALRARDDVTVEEWSSRLPVRLVGPLWQRGRWGPPPRAGIVTHAPSLLVPPGTSNLVVTVHDLLWRDLPDGYSPRARRWHEDALRAAIKSSRALITPSSNTADRLVHEGARTDQVHILAHGADHLPPPDFDLARTLLEGHGIERFVFSISTLEPRKNLPRLMEAFSRVRGQEPDLALVIAGPVGWGPALVPAPGVHLVGAVSNEVAVALYQLSAVTAYVPLAEGFGLPALEAMAQGSPLVGSPVPSLPADYPTVDPTDEHAIADDIALVLRNSDECAARRARGHEIAATHRWNDVAARHLEIYRSVLP